MTRISDNENICLHCRHAEEIYRVREKGEKEFCTVCLCSYAMGKNKGRRKTCVDYEPQKEG